MATKDPNGTGTTRDAGLERELGGLRRRYEQLRDRKVRTEQDIANYTDQLDALKAQARERYGTDDPEELQALWERKRQENEAVVADYREHINKVQAELTAVEQAMGGRGEGSGE